MQTLSKTRGGMILCLLLLFASLVPAQMQFQHITSSEGISQSEVYCFLEDSQGFMWFGTVDGLNRYDGYQVSTYHTDRFSANSISNNTIRCLAEDDQGRIWIGTDNGLCVYDASMETIHQLPLRRFHEKRLTIFDAQIKPGYLFLGTSLGLMRLDVRTHNLEQIDEEAQLISVAENDPVVACTIGNDGLIWFTTANSLYQIQSSEKLAADQVLDLSENLPDLRDLEMDRLGNLWIVSHDHGFVRFNTQSKSLRRFQKPDIPSEKISCVTIDQSGDLWIGTHDQGLLYADKKSLHDAQPTFLSIEHDPYNDRSLSSNLIYSLFVSKSNLLWIGTIGSGINVYDPRRKPFHYYNLHNANNQSSYNTNFIRAVYADQTDNIWIGTHNNGLFVLDRSENGSVEKIGFGTESIFHLNDAGEERVFVCSGQGISLAKKGKGSLQMLSSLSIGPSFYVTQTEGDIFWVATLSGVKRCRLNGDQIVVEQSYSSTSTPALSFDNCRVLYLMQESRKLLIGTEGGGLNVLQLDNELNPVHSRVYQQSDSAHAISNNYIRSIVQAANSDVWIGTYEGLNKMQWDASGKLRFTAYTMQDGLPNNTIQSIAADGQNRLWIGTNKGLCKFEPETETFTQYTLNDGIQSNEFSEHTIFKKTDNEIIIGGINGINTFYPEQIVASDVSPNLTLTDFYLFNKRIRVGERTADGEPGPLRKSIALTDTILLEPD
ncbi:MAG: two-component regulator propeller domain-containing protein, partial [Bacteroidota bacterium]